MLELMYKSKIFDHSSNALVIWAVFTLDRSEVPNVWHKNQFPDDNSLPKVVEWDWPNYCYALGKAQDIANMYRSPASYYGHANVKAFWHDNRLLLRQVFLFDF